uniref:Pancreatic progenitor cell differentiation and proliferation factor like n=1 Tax=Varanus komodoensis TaxID=61221 RepID=A0A8D2IW06_VARKO
MAAVPSAGSLLAKNQYYRNCSVSSSSSSCCSEPITFSEQDKPLHGLPEVFERCWWIKSFFHCESMPQDVGRKTLSAS